MYKTLDYLSDDQIAELEHSYLYSMARHVEGKTFEQYVNEVRPYVGDDQSEHGVEEDRIIGEHMGKRNYVDVMNQYFDSVEDSNDPILRRQLEEALGEPADPEATQMADEREHYVSGNHYNDVVPGMQYMEMMQYMLDGKSGVEAHLFGQIYKYLMRAGKKDDYEQDMRKATWYAICLTKYIHTGTVSADDNDIIKLMDEINNERNK